MRRGFLPVLLAAGILVLPPSGSSQETTPQPQPAPLWSEFPLDRANPAPAPRPPASTAPATTPTQSPPRQSITLTVPSEPAPAPRTEQPSRPAPRRPASTTPAATPAQSRPRGSITLTVPSEPAPAPRSEQPSPPAPASGPAPPRPARAQTARSSEDTSSSYGWRLAGLVLAASLGLALLTATALKRGRRSPAPVPAGPPDEDVAVALLERVETVSAPDIRGEEALLRVLVVDSHTIVRHGLRATLPSDRLEVVEEAATAAAALEAAERVQPDVIIIDPSLPDGGGAGLCARLGELAPEATVVVFTAQSGDESVRAALAAGVRAYLLKESAHVQLPEVITRARAGEIVVDALAAPRRLELDGDGNVPRLSEQELNVVRLAAEGLTNREIGIRLHLSRYTVKEYLSNAMRKLDAGSRVEAVVKAGRHGLIEAAPPSRGE